MAVPRSTPAWNFFCIRPYFETVSGVWPNTVILGVSSFASQHRFAEKFV